MKDLSLKDLNIKKETNEIALHSFFGAFSIFIITFIDGLFLSIKSEIDFSTSIVSAPLIFLILSIFIGISNALVVYISKLQNISFEEKVSKTNGIIMVVMIFAVITISLSYLNLSYFIDLIGIKDELKEKSYNYIIWHYLGLPFCVYITVAGSKMKALGNAKVISKLMMYSAIINVICDPIFIFYYDLGAEGAAIATFISWVLVSSFYFISNLSNKKDSLKKDFSEIKEFSKIIPSFVVAQILNTALGLITLFFINQYSVTEISAYGFVYKLEKLITIIAFSFSSSIIMIGGQNINNKKRIFETLNYSIKQVALLNTLYLFILLLLIKPIAVLCGFSEQTSQLSFDFIIILSLGYFCISLSNLYSGYLYIFNKHNRVMISNTIKVFVLLPPLIYIGDHYFGYIGIMYGISLTFLLSLCFLIFITKKEFYIYIKSKENNNEDNNLKMVKEI